MMRAALLASLALLGGCMFVESEPDPGGCLDLFCDEGCADPAPGCEYDGNGDGCSACGGDFWTCEDGEWGETICEPPPVDIQGVITIRQSIVNAVGSCPTATPRDPLVLTVVPAGAEPKTVTADLPTVVNQAELTEGFSTALIDIYLTDDWGDGITRNIHYDLEADELGGVWGSIFATHGDCEESLTIDGSSWGEP